MNAADIPFFAALVFPGFFAIQTFSWAIPGRSMSDVLRIVWSFVFSVPIFFGLHGLVRHVGCLSSGALPSPETIAGNPADAPIWFLTGLYFAGAVGGYALGLLWRMRVLDGPLHIIGLDVRRHRDVLTQALDQGAYIDVKLNDGTLLRGWPFMSSGEEDPNRFIYLVRAQRMERDNGWRGIRDVLIPVDTVARIYFLEGRRPLQRAGEADRSGDRMSWFRWHVRMWPFNLSKRNDA